MGRYASYMSSLFWQHSGFDQWKVAYKFVMSHVLNKPCNTSTIYHILWIKGWDVKKQETWIGNSEINVNENCELGNLYFY